MYGVINLSVEVEQTITRSRSCIVFSYGPVPTPEQDKVEGGGLRCWGLAKGLRSQNDELDITVAYHESYRKESNTEEFEGIKIATWTNDSLEKLMQGFDTVIVSYCMGDLSVTIANTIHADQQLVLDCYVPIYVEISARGSEDLEGEYAAFEHEVTRWAAVLRRGDLYLCANDNQKRYYQGVLSALGRVNPVTYDDELILIVPYGIYSERPSVKSKPITKLIASTSSKDYKKILWFGAVYPWFDLRMLVDAINKVNEKTPTKLIIVGAKNPFNAHPDFVKRYDELMEYINSSDVNKSNIIMQDWVDFNSRADWYMDSDAVILINKVGSENELAWRTRLVDYIWADLPIFTNGGDPLGEQLISAGAAARLENLSSDGLAKSISEFVVDSSGLDALKKNLSSVRKKFYWESVTNELYKKIINHTRPTDFTKFGLMEVEATSAFQRSSTGRALKKAKKLPSYYAKYGAKNTYTAARTAALKRLKKLPMLNRGSRVVFVAHQLDTTGAPHVFIDAVKDFRKDHPSIPVEFHTFNPAVRANIAALNAVGIKPKLHISRDIPLPCAQGDVVVLNTVAFSETTRDSIYSQLEKGTIKKLIWYIHEDEPSLIFEPGETKRIKHLMDRGLITIFTAAAQTKNHYIEHFGHEDSIKTQIYRVAVAKKYHNVRKAEDFNSMRFILPGMVGDGRKGQLPVLYAFIEFKKRYFDTAPENYRDFSLEYIGVGKDFLSRQLLKHTDAGLGHRFSHHGPISHEACLDLVLDANVTICYSMRECLPMFVYEGMIAGHPLLRNDSSGIEEQLIEGKNGYYLDSNDFEQLVQTIERICNKKETKNAQLAQMSKASYDIAVQLEQGSYDHLGAEIVEAFGRRL